MWSIRPFAFICQRETAAATILFFSWTYSIFLELTRNECRSISKLCLALYETEWHNSVRVCLVWKVNCGNRGTLFSTISLAGEWLNSNNLSPFGKRESAICNKFQRRHKFTQKCQMVRFEFILKSIQCLHRSFKFSQHGNAVSGEHCCCWGKWGRIEQVTAVACLGPGYDLNRSRFACLPKSICSRDAMQFSCYCKKLLCFLSIDQLTSLFDYVCQSQALVHLIAFHSAGSKLCTLRAAYEEVNCQQHNRQKEFDMIYEKRVIWFDVSIHPSFATGGPQHQQMVGKVEKGENKCLPVRQIWKWQRSLLVEECNRRQACTDFISFPRSRCSTWTAEIWI